MLAHLPLKHSLTAFRVGSRERPLPPCSANSSASGLADVANDQVDLLEKLLQWPAHSLFPALDILRLIVLDEQTALLLASRAGPLELSPLGEVPHVTGSINPTLLYSTTYDVLDLQTFAGETVQPLFSHIQLHTQVHQMCFGQIAEVCSGQCVHPVRMICSCPLPIWDDTDRQLVSV